MHCALTKYLPYYKRNLKVAFPVMLTQLGAALVGLFDSIMVGHYATTDLAAVSFSNAIFFTVMVFAMGAVMGITPLVGFHAGRMGASSEPETIEAEQTAIASLLHHAVKVNLLLCVGVGALLGGVIPFLDCFGQDPAVVQVARPYYTLIVISILPFLVFCLQKQFLEGLGNTLVAMIITLMVNLVNILLNWVLIYGHWGFPAMGATGAGIATLISRTLMPICFLVVLLWRQEWRDYLHRAWCMVHGASCTDTKRLLQIGLPIGAQTVLESLIFTMAFVIVGWISKEALAAHQVANQIADITFMTALGIGAATTIRVSHQYGKGDLYAVRMASMASIHLVLAMNTIGATLMIAFRYVIPLAFTSDPKVMEIASTLILFAGMFQYADGLQTVGAAMLRGIADVRVPMGIAFVSYILVALPIGLICTFPLHMGAPGMWVGFIVGLSLAAILFHTRFHRLMKAVALSATCEP